VNRLDRETSGLALVAKTGATARDFGLLMQRRQFRKEYLAIVWGWPDWKHKIVDAPLDRQGKHQRSAIWLKQMVHPVGAPAQTEFRVERRFIRSALTDLCGLHGVSFDPHLLPLPRQGEEVAKRQVRVGEQKFALIRAIPRTGRTHQIRVHLSSLGHPIVGDKIYGPNEQLYLRFIETGWTPELQKKLLLPRHALHSAKLAIKGEREWTSELPPDLANFVR
jgi:23S rRNA pseudouridine1911/1915/1917 synthase